ncbi:Hint domain-containing protein [Rhodobacteraceae bacterium 2376]|uniref:Hint domain-containing protein n=1 Tax=Rhabdonatronobacter sediminivivens TaxID=2743469 RepID=A0A7Z0KZG8_9RHOB|nr:Hint domain-containing protein [Rhabdonatronobacter sediminivivens]NYS24413.1 Hint domain-containing protein [Rhabdonatronobacter sediminivivens]
MFDTTIVPRATAPQATTLPRVPRLCGFGAGTLIETASGPVAVESLLAGDMLLTADGAQAVLRGMQVVTLHDALAVVIAPASSEGGLTGTGIVIGPEQAIARPDMLAGSGLTLRSAEPSRLIHSMPGLRMQRVPTLRLYQLQCDRDVTIVTHGLHALLPTIRMDHAPAPHLH